MPPLNHEVMNAPSTLGNDRHVDVSYSSYSSSGCGSTCPRCNGSAYRVPRRLADLLMSMFIKVRRYRCHSMDCGWEGNLRVKRNSLLMRGPW
jgi:hypothetical protein